MGDFSPYWPVFGPRIAPLRRPGLLLHRMTGTETGAPQQVAILPAREWALAMGTIRPRVRSPADLAHGTGPLRVVCGPLGACAQRRCETSAPSGRRSGGGRRSRSSITLASFATRRQIAAGSRSHHPRSPFPALRRRACSRTLRRRAEGRGCNERPFACKARSPTRPGVPREACPPWERPLAAIGLGHRAYC